MRRSRRPAGRLARGETRLGQPPCKICRAAKITDLLAKDRGMPKRLPFQTRHIALLPIVITSGTRAIRQASDVDDVFRCVRFEGAKQIPPWSRCRSRRFSMEEIVAVNGDGQPSFNSLQNFGEGAAAILFYAFDARVLVGADLRYDGPDGTARSGRRSSYSSYFPPAVRL
jgi:hypothetical protein